jgi:4-hydroxy-3-polyprenylbenzoate decarboxylase
VIEREAQSLRGYLAALETRGELLRVGRTVDRQFELGAWLTVDDDGPALLFESVAGSAHQVIGNVATTRARLAMAVNADADSLTERIADAVDERHPAMLVASAPCHEVVEDAVDLDRLPIPWFFEHETAPYITAGAIVARDPETGRRNFSIARLKPIGRARAMIGIAPNHHLAILARNAARRGERLPIAVAIGLHPALLIAASLYLELGDDELECAGHLLGRPVELAKCRSVDLEVPAWAEVTLEGSIGSESVDEGPVSEFHGMYEDYGDGLIVDFTTLTHRAQPLIQVILPGYHPEHALLGGVAIAAVLRRAVARTGLGVSEVAVGMAGAGRLSATVALTAPRQGDAWRAAFAVWGAVSLVKHVTVVDADVDAWDEAAVQHARLTRARPDRDVLIVPGARADRSDPLESDGVTAKWAVDATIRPLDRPLGFTPATPPPDVSAAVAQQWRELFGDR